MYMLNDRFLPCIPDADGINEWMDSLALDYLPADIGYFADRNDYRAMVTGALPSELN